MGFCAGYRREGGMNATRISRSPCLVGASPSLADEAIRTGAAAFGDWRTDGPGVRRLITPADLPAPYATHSAANRSQHAARAGIDIPKAPPGFSVDLFTSGLNNAARHSDRAERRHLRGRNTAPGACAFFTRRKAALGLRKARSSPKGSIGPMGLHSTLRGRTRALSMSRRRVPLCVFPTAAVTLKASGPGEKVASLPGGGGHWTRDLAFSADDKTLFVSVGSGSNDDEGVPRADQASIAQALLGASLGEEEGRADVLAFDPDGKNERVYATGIRNCSGLADSARQRARSGAPSTSATDWATTCRPTMRRTWPKAPSMAGPGTISATIKTRATRTSGLISRKAITTPDVLIQAHSAPLGIAFYGADQFPAEYKGDAFVTLHGSWNRAKRTGYKVVRLLMKDGKPTGAVRGFPCSASSATTKASGAARSASR